MGIGIDKKLINTREKEKTSASSLLLGENIRYSLLFLFSKFRTSLGLLFSGWNVGFNVIAPKPFD